MLEFHLFNGLGLFWKKKKNKKQKQKKNSELCYATLHGKPNSLKLRPLSSWDGGKERYKQNETIGLGRDINGKKSALLTARLGGEGGNEQSEGLTNRPLAKCLPARNNCIIIMSAPT